MKKDRITVIEELYAILNEIKGFILQTIGFSERDEKVKDLINDLIMQCLVLWIFQRKSVFNNDTSYLITKFKEISSGCLTKYFENYFEFFNSFIQIITSSKNTYVYKDDIFGELMTYGSIILIIDKKKYKSFHIPNICFYVEERKNPAFKMNSTKEKEISPIFNCLERLDWEKGTIDEFVLGAIYEKLITHRLKKKSGAFYTPEEISNFTSKTTIEYYFIEKINLKFNSDFKLLNDILNSRDQDILIYLFELLQGVSILDPAVGTGHFLESEARSLLDIYYQIWNRCKRLRLKSESKLEITSLGRKKIKINLLDFSNQEKFNFYILYHIFSKNIYGIDINKDVIKIAKVRLFLFVMKYFKVSVFQNIKPVDIRFNLKWGNSLIGFIGIPQVPLQKQQHLDTFFTGMKSTSSYTNEITSEDLGLIENHNLHFDERDQFNVNLKSKFDLVFSQTYNIELGKLKRLKLFHWFLEFPTVFSKKSGFDIIIANPPYLGESGNKELFRIFSLCLNDYYEGKIDLWYLFLHRSLDLMNSNANLSFVTSNYWLTASGAEKLRSKILSKTSIISFINFGENRAFSNAQGVHTNIITLKKANSPNSNIKTILFEKSYPINTDLIDKLDNQLIFEIDQRKLVLKDWDSYFHFLPEEYRVIIEYIIHNSTMLKNEGFNTKEGIVTGLNNISAKQIRKFDLSEDMKGIGVFILDKKDERDLYLIEDFNNDELALLKPFYKNSDIRRFHTNIQSTKKILYLNRHMVNLEILPNIKRHLKRFSEVLEESLDNPPFLNRPRNQDIFTKYKIITPQRSVQNSFAYNSYDWYAAQDVYYILSQEWSKNRLKSLLLILNSKLAYFWFYWMGKRKGKQLELFGEPLNYFPISKKFDRFIKLSKLADYLLFLYSIENLDEKMNQIKIYFDDCITNSLIYELYFEDEFDFIDKMSYNDSSLLQLVNNCIKKIDLEEWLGLNYKIEFLKAPQDESIHKIEFLRNKIFQIINESYIVLKKDDRVQRIIDLIHSQKWIKTISHPVNIPQK